MTPFNLNDFIANPSRKVITRDGRSVSIKGIDPNNHSKINAVTEDNHFIVVDYDGHYYSRSDSQFDLFFATEVKEKWVNLYKSDGEYHFGSTMFNSKEEAENIDEKHPTYVATIKIEWEE